MKLSRSSDSEDLRDYFFLVDGLRQVMSLEERRLAAEKACGRHRASMGKKAVTEVRMQYLPRPSQYRRCHY